jgi:hypothetical protein
LTATETRVTISGMPHDNPIMFCHDSTTIFYPTGPGRVHMIAIAALYDCDGSDEDFADSTPLGDCRDMACQGLFIVNGPPSEWPKVYIDDTVTISEAATAEDFADCLEQWADWCDRDSARLDSLDEVKGRIGRAA